ncbi:Hypothetical predicted protein [Octopus vulgaris]|uniref:Uncharacterized protein n=1 Tax=Octopus vulgaris TaxID=6645 RepID=A0AA36BBW5_OCTVU|nr:Hypothetical predicted protein [Octopus vulgaris]
MGRLFCAMPEDPSLSQERQLSVTSVHEGYRVWVGVNIGVVVIVVVVGDDGGGVEDCAAVVCAGGGVEQGVVMVLVLVV